MSKRRADRPKTQWLAAVLDSRGCFTIRQKGFYPSVMVTGTNRRLLERARKLSGMGNVGGPYKDRRGNRKPRYIWRVTSIKQVRKLLKGVLPHLVAKRKQARVLLRAIALRRKLIEHVDELKDLNP